MRIDALGTLIKTKAALIDDGMSGGSVAMQPRPLSNPQHKEPISRHARQGSYRRLCVCYREFRILLDLGELIDTPGDVIKQC